MKPLIKTRTFWTGAGSLLSGIGLIVTGNKADGLQLIFTGLTAIFLRSAVNK